MGRRASLAVVAAFCSSGVLVGVMTATASSQAAEPAASPIRHVVIIYQENHSFDNTLGDLCVVDHRCNGSIAPLRLKSGVSVTPKVSPDIVPSVDHTVHGQLTAEDGGKMDGWAELSGCDAPSYGCITYYRPSQIPSLAALARQFVISDRTFQSADSPSWGAHLELAAATLDGFTGNNPSVLPPAGVPLGPGWGCDSNRSAQWVSPTGNRMSEPSCIPDPSLPKPNGGAFKPTPVAHVPTIMDRLTAAGLSWRIYAKMPSLTNLKNNYTWAICPTFADCLYTGLRKNMVPTANILADAGAGHLPALSLVMPAPDNQNTSQHNYESMLRGDNWIGQMVSAIEHGPDWASTAIFITYDDCGCFYDHVPPPPGKGIRAPMVIVSPYARPGYTDSTPADDVGSMLAFVEHTFNVPPLTAVDANAYDYRGSFNYAQRPLKPNPLPAPGQISDAEQRLLDRLAVQNLDDPT